MHENSQLTGSAALAEIQHIQTDAQHPDHAKFAASDPTTIHKVSELWRSTENGESAEPKPLAAEPEKKTSRRKKGRTHRKTLRRRVKIKKRRPRRLGA